MASSNMDGCGNFMKYSLFIVNLLIFVSSTLLYIQSTNCYIIVVPAVLYAMLVHIELVCKQFIRQIYIILTFVVY